MKAPKKGIYYSESNHLGRGKKKARRKQGRTQKPNNNLPTSRRWTHWPRCVSRAYRRTPDCGSSRCRNRSTNGRRAVSASWRRACRASGRWGSAPSVDSAHRRPCAATPPTVRRRTLAWKLSLWSGNPWRALYQGGQKINTPPSLVHRSPSRVTNRAITHSDLSACSRRPSFGPHRSSGLADGAAFDSGRRNTPGTRGWHRSVFPARASWCGSSLTWFPARSGFSVWSVLFAANKGHGAKRSKGELNVRQLLQKLQQDTNTHTHTKTAYYQLRSFQPLHSAAWGNCFFTCFGLTHSLVFVWTILFMAEHSNFAFRHLRGSHLLSINSTETANKPAFFDKVQCRWDFSAPVRIWNSTHRAEMF